MTEVVKGLVALNEQGYVITDQHMETNIPGIYAVGDIRIKGLRQIVTAAAMVQLLLNMLRENTSEFSMRQGS